jgi:hypothetical protein
MNQTKQYNIIISFLVIIFFGIIVIIYKQHKPNLEGFRGPAKHCGQTSLTYDQGARCIGSDYRNTKGWCCSDYGKSKGYKWADPNNMIGGSNMNMNNMSMNNMSNMNGGSNVYL